MGPFEHVAQSNRTKGGVNGLADFYRKVWAIGNAGIDVSLGILRGPIIREITVPSGDRYQFLRLKPIKIL